MTKKAILGLIALCMTFHVWAGGGWPQPKGKGYFKLAEWWTIADQHYTTSGMIDPNLTFGLYNTTVYAEYGFSNNITGILYVPILSRAVVNNEISRTTQEIITPGEAINTIGDAELTLKYGIINNGTVALSASVMLGLPLGESSGGTRNNLQTGDGEFNQMLRLDLGIPLGGNESTSYYANVYAGFNNRTKGFSDEYRFGAELGAGILNQKLWLIGRLDAIKSRMDQPDGAVTASFFANNSEFVSISGELSYMLSQKIGISVGAAGALSGRIVYANPSFTVGVFAKL